MFILQQNIATALKMPYSSQMVANSYKTNVHSRIRYSLKHYPFWQVINSHACWSRTPQGHDFWKVRQLHMKIMDTTLSSRFFDVWGP